VTRQTKIERIGGFTLTLTFDHDGALTRAETADSVLELGAGDAGGEYRARDGSGSERWEAGRVRGTWLDAPYAHECDVDEVIDRTAWIERTLTVMRSAVFFAGLRDRGSRPTPKRWRAIWAYAVEHDLLRREVSSAAAQSCVHQYAGVANGRELARLIEYCEARQLRDYLRVAEAGARKQFRDDFQVVAIPDAEREASAIARATTLYATVREKLTEGGGPALGPATLDASDPGAISHMNNLSRALIDAGMIGDARRLLDAIRAIVGAREPADELRWTATSARFAMDEYFFRHHAASWCWAAKTYAAGIADARRAVVLEDLLDRQSLAGKLEPKAFGSSGAWALMSCLAETKEHAQAAELFAAMLSDHDRLRRRLDRRPALEIALVAGFYAMFKAKPVDPLVLGPRFEAALSVVAAPTQGLLAHWYAFVCCALDRVDEAEKFVRLAVSLGVDGHAIVSDDEWKPLIAKHALAAREPWRSWLGRLASAP
jgi:hypothetical protein